MRTAIELVGEVAEPEKVYRSQTTTPAARETTINQQPNSKLQSI
jgi:hypothetical protein